MRKAGRGVAVAELTRYTPLLTPKQVAGILGLSPSTVSAMLRRGELPGKVILEGRGAKRIRRIYRVQYADLEAFIEERSTGRSGGVR